MIKERYIKAIEAGQVTSYGANKCGMVYEWGFAGPDGAWFTLFRDKRHTVDDIRAAKRELRSERDVVSITVVKLRRE